MLLRPIQMIATFDEDGAVKPYRFKMTDDSGETVVFQVKKIIDKRQETILRVRYLLFTVLCVLEKDGENYAKEFTVKFDTSTCRWWITKIV